MHKMWGKQCCLWQTKGSDSGLSECFKSSCMCMQGLEEVSAGNYFFVYWCLCLSHSRGCVPPVCKHVCNTCCRTRMSPPGDWKAGGLPDGWHCSVFKHFELIMETEILKVLIKFTVGKSVNWTELRFNPIRWQFWHQTHTQWKYKVWC